MSGPLHHTVKLTIGSSGLVGGEITCSAPAGSPCRLTCPTKQCTEWEGAECECGPLVEYPGGCLAVEWIENEDVIDTYVGPDAEIRSGPVEIEWHGEGYRWTYPAVPTTPEPDPSAPVRDERAVGLRCFRCRGTWFGESCVHCGFEVAEPVPAGGEVLNRPADHA